MNHSFWNHSPFVRLLIPLILGILLYHEVHWNTNLFYTLSFLTIVLYVLSYFVQKKLLYSLRWLRGVLLSSTLFILGYVTCYLHDPIHQASHYEQHIEHYSFAKIQLQQYPEIKARSIKLSGSIKAMYRGDSIVNTHGDCLLYLPKDTTLLQLRPGTTLMVYNRFKKIENTKNPGAFDYADYCAKKGIFRQAYLPKGSWHLIDSSENNSLRYLALKTNLWVRKILAYNITNVEALSIAEALLIGYRKDIDPELWQAYSHTGIVHIIAISGLHMGMIYGIFRYLFISIPFLSKRKSMALILALVAMWLFAFITGLPPSVKRASLMFSFIAIGEMQQRKINVYNNLSASAFLLLCFNPNLLFDIGFQLSYLAVASIVSFFPSINQLIYTPHKALSYLWSILSGSTAAQILTLPLCIYYFHQFPVLFFISNLIAIPFAAVTLSLSLLLIPLSVLPQLASPIGLLLQSIILAFNTCIRSMSSLPYALWRDIRIDYIQMALLYIILLTALGYLYTRYRAAIYTCLSSIFIYMLYTLVISIKSQQQSFHIILDAPQKSILQIVHARSSYFITHDSVLHSLADRQYILQPAYLYFQSKLAGSQHLTMASKVGIKLIAIHQKIIAILSRNIECNQPMYFDHLILSKGISPSFSMANIDAKMLSFDSTVPHWLQQQLAAKIKISHPHLIIHHTPTIFHHTN